jgi:hypothetical protein
MLVDFIFFFGVHAKVSIYSFSIFVFFPFDKSYLISFYTFLDDVKEIIKKGLSYVRLTVRPFHPENC